MNESQPNRLFGLSSVAIARRTDPATSHAAAKSVKNITQVQKGILWILNYGPCHDVGMIARYNGARTHMDKAELCPLASDSGLRTRRRELTDRGYVKDTGTTVKLQSGRMAVVWAITEKGKEIVHAL